MSEVFAAIDLGGTYLRGALGLATGEILARRSAPTHSEQGPAAVLARMADLVADLARETGRWPVAIGVAVPGLVDVSSGVTLFLPNLPTQWRGIAVAAALAGRLEAPVKVLNDVRTATLGELTFGLGRTARTLVFFSLGTGVGGGVAIDGRLRLGPLGAAGELGHQTILPEGPLCGCGNRGCLEALASGPAITGEGARLVRAGLAPRLHEQIAGDLNRITPSEMSAAAAAGDEPVRAALLRAAGYVGIAVANVVTILHPDLVVLGGGVAEIGDLLLDRVRQVVRERVGMFPTDGVRIERSALGDGAGLLGALALAASGVDGRLDS